MKGPITLGYQLWTASDQTTPKGMARFSADLFGMNSSAMRSGTSAIQPRKLTSKFGMEAAMRTPESAEAASTIQKRFLSCVLVVVSMTGSFGEGKYRALARTGYFPITDSRRRR